MIFAPRIICRMSSSVDGKHEWICLQLIRKLWGRNANKQGCATSQVFMIIPCMFLKRRTTATSLCRWGVSSNESWLYLGKTPASVHTVEHVVRSTRSGQLLELRYLFTLGNKWSSDRREVYENNEIGHKIAEKTSTLFRCWTLSTPLKSIRWTTVLLPFWFHKPHVSSSSRRWSGDGGHAYTDTVKIDVMWSCICEQVALERHGSR